MRWSGTSISASGSQARGNDRAPEFSAGGVVVRGDEVVTIVPVKRDANGRRVLGLPKGHPEAGETAEQAAIREVREEAGVTVDLIEPLGEVSYTYERRGRRIAKRVTFFLFAYRDGDLADHDHEIEDARWMPLAEAAEQLSYAGEREMVRRVLSRPPQDL
jgi:8-oxo-dGTP pyrophosphatase MutT (NUDIX family)